MNRPDHSPWRRRLGASAIGWLAAFATGVALALMLRGSGNWNEGLDWERQMMLGIDRTVPRLFDVAMLVLPWFGTNITIMPLLIAAALWLAWRRRRWDLAAHLVIVQVGSLTLNSLLKAVFERERPELWEHRGQYAWSAYPSGHAIASVSVLYTVAVLLHRERGWRWPYLVVTALLVISMYSRLYLGVHWPTDVVGGMAVGAVWLAATLYAFRPSVERRTAG